jgi:hypothetical protein
MYLLCETVVLQVFEVEADRAVPCVELTSYKGIQVPVQATKLVTQLSMSTHPVTKILGNRCESHSSESYLVSSLVARRDWRYETDEGNDLVSEVTSKFEPRGLSYAEATIAGLRKRWTQTTLPQPRRIGCFNSSLNKT